MTRPAPDLRSSFPRSPADILGGFVILARTIDKCRATIAGTAGEYIFNCPVDRRFFDFTDIDAEEFRAVVAQGKSDAEIVAWVKSRTTALSETEIAAWCHDQLQRRPVTVDEKTYFEQARRRFAPHHPYISRWFELLDAEEGRLTPVAA